MEPILFDMDEKGFARITLNRPHKLNSVTKQMSKQLYEAVRKAKSMKDLKFLVITGTGTRAFCTGGDLNELHGGLSTKEAYAYLHPMKKVLLEIATFPVPTIALLNGQARGGGCEIATACDFRYATEAGEFGFVQGSLGITPGWGGGVLLYKRVKSDFAAHWLMDSEMYSAEEAYKLGWLHKRLAIENLLGAIETSSFLNKTPEQMRIFKRQYLTELSIENLSEQMEEEVQQCARLWESKKHKDAVEKFLNRR